MMEEDSFHATVSCTKPGRWEKRWGNTGCSWWSKLSGTQD
jgi:hypothetical protein